MKLFEPKVRDRAIETTCSNLIMARQLRPEPGEVAMYMAAISKYSDSELAQVLVGSHILYDEHLGGKCWVLN